MSRFTEPQHPDFQAINTSLAFDRCLWPYDIAQSKAHASMLASASIITAAEAGELRSGLDAVAAELDGGTFAFDQDDEDIHTAIERRLTEIVGVVGGKLHRRGAVRPGRGVWISLDALRSDRGGAARC
jgi:argininosuccinate lyase